MFGPFRHGRKLKRDQHADILLRRGAVVGLTLSLLAGVLSLVSGHMMRIQRCAEGETLTFAMHESARTDCAYSDVSLTIRATGRTTTADRAVQLSAWPALDVEVDPGTAAITLDFTNPQPQTTFDYVDVRYASVGAAPRPITFLTDIDAPDQIEGEFTITLRTTNAVSIP